jgi:predicted small metal-binding protein
MPNGQKIFLIDTPGFDDTYRSDTDILGEIADWLAQSYRFQIRLTGIIYLHRITDVRVGGQGMKNLRMFRKVCGEKNLGSVLLVTTMWSLCPPSDANNREAQLTSNSDLWKFLIGKGARIFRHDRGQESGQQILDYLLARGRKITLDIQHEMIDEGKQLVETNAGREVQADIEKLKEAHKKEMQEIREDMEEAIRSQDTERQEELRAYKAQVNKQMQEAQNQARQLELSREQLRKQLKEEHGREMATLRAEVERRQNELERTSRLDAERYETLQRELMSMKDKESRYRMKEYHRYKYKYRCPGCRTSYLMNTRKETLTCNTAGCELVSDVTGLEMAYDSDDD